MHAQGLTTVEALSRIAATEIPGIIVKTTLCEENGAFVYRILVREAGGKLTAARSTRVRRSAADNVCHAGSQCGSHVLRLRQAPF